MAHHARAPAMEGIDFEVLVDTLEHTVDPLIKSLGGKGTPNTISATYTGNMPIVVDAQQILLRELTTSYLAAFAIIAVVIIIAVRSIPAGLVAMLPNLFPTVILFGIMGWMNKPLDIGALMTASVALGIAVDDTLHCCCGSAAIADRTISSSRHHRGTATLRKGHDSFHADLRVRDVGVHDG